MARGSEAPGWQNEAEPLYIGYRLIRMNIRLYIIIRVPYK